MGFFIGFHGSVVQWIILLYKLLHRMAFTLFLYFFLQIGPDHIYTRHNTPTPKQPTFCLNNNGIIMQKKSQ